jgi:solute:Na+ symporter, SSS family
VTLHLSTLDIAVIAAYFALSIFVGTWAARRGQGTEEFLMAGRRMTLPVFVGSLVATWYGGILGVGEIAYSDGLVNWLTQGGFWYASYFLFAFFLAGRISRSKLSTLPDQVGELHGPAARAIATGLNYLNVVPVSYALSLGIMIHLFTGWPVALGILAGSGVTVAYSTIGGFRGVLYADMLQFALMCTAVAVVVPFAVFGLGGAAWLVPRLPEAHLRITGRYSFQELAVWALIALSTLVDPNFYHRCYAARDPRIARRGVLLSILFWALFDVCTTFSGLYARAALPGVDPKLAYPLLADRILPPGLKGLFVAGTLATIMSTSVAYSFVGAMGLGHDLFRRTLRPDASERATVLVTRAGILVTSGVACGLAVLFDRSIKSIWKTVGSLSTSAILVPMLLGLAGIRAEGAAVASMLGGILGTGVWAALREWGGGFALGIEALVPGLALSLGGYLAMVLRGQRAARRSKASRDDQ